MRAGAAPILPGGPALIVVRGCGAVIKTKLKTKNKKNTINGGSPLGGRGGVGVGHPLGALGRRRDTSWPVRWK